MFRTILVPLDISPITDELVQYAVMFARAHSAKLVFFHASQDYGASDEGALQRSIDPANYREHILSEVRTALNVHLDFALQQGVETQMAWAISDHPAESIVAAAQQHDCELIIIASHGRRGLNKLLLGSETTKVVEQSAVPVLVTKI